MCLCVCVCVCVLYQYIFIHHNSSYNNNTITITITTTTTTTVLLLVALRVETWFQKSVSDSPKILLPPIWEHKESHNTTSFVRYLSYFLNSRTRAIRTYSNTILYILRYVLNWYFVFRFTYFLRARKIAKNEPSRAKMDTSIRYLHDVKHLNVSLGT